MKKLTSLILLICFAFTFTACSDSDDTPDNGSDGNNGLKSYGSFSVTLQPIGQEIQTLKYFNYLAQRSTGEEYLKTWLNMSDSNFDKDKNGDFPGGTLSVAINKPQAGLYTLIAQQRFVNIHTFGDKEERLKNWAYINVSIGLSNKSVNGLTPDVIYEMMNTKDSYEDALEVTIDKDGVFHYNILTPVTLENNGGVHGGSGHPLAPGAVVVTIKDGHYAAE